MEQVLANLRLICLPSEYLGQDWREKSAQIDEMLPLWGMDLSEESVFLLFSRAPGAVLEGEGQCMVARPVVGPKRELEAPYKLIDWVQSLVYMKQLKARDFDSVFQEAFEAWQDLQRKGVSTAPSFMLRLTRRLLPELRLDVELIMGRIDFLSGRASTL